MNSWKIGPTMMVKVSVDADMCLGIVLWLTRAIKTSQLSALGIPSPSDGFYLSSLDRIMGLVGHLELQNWE